MANHVDEIEREHGSEEAPDRDVGITIGRRCQHTGQGSQPPEDPDQPVTGEEQRHKDSQGIECSWRDQYVDGAAIGNGKTVADGVFSHRNRHPFGMEEHVRIDQRTCESAETGADANDPFANLSGLDKVAAQRELPQP